MKRKEDIHKTLGRYIAGIALVFPACITIAVLMGMAEYGSTPRHIGMLILGILVTAMFWRICSPILGDLSKPDKED